MATVTKKYVVTRKSTSDVFGNWTEGDLCAYAVALNELPINSIVVYSADLLTRTRIESYDDSIEPQIAAIQEKFATALAAETERRNTAGFTSTTETLTSAPAEIDPAVVSVPTSSTTTTTQTA
jgi:hypothetical protein